MALTVLYRDEYYVAVNKPAGLLVHPTPEAAGERDTVISSFGEEPPPGAVV